MGKKKIEIVNKIANENSRNITYGKRYKGLIKKAMELSILCEQQIFITIYDETKEKLIVYSSSEDITIDSMQVIVNKHSKAGIGK